MTALREIVDRNEMPTTSNTEIKASESVQDLRGKVRTSLVALQDLVETQEKRIAKANPEEEILAACARDPLFVDEVDLVKEPVKEDALKEVPRGIVSSERTKFTLVENVENEEELG